MKRFTKLLPENWAIFCILAIGVILQALKSVQTTPVSQGPYKVPGDIVYGCPSLRGVTLTFDDGPAKYTDKLLDMLLQYNLKATFFVLGYHVASNADIIHRMYREGHVIGSHTWSHSDLGWYYNTGNLTYIEKQMLDTENAIQSVIGVKPWLFRPPFGSLPPGLKKILVNRGYTIVMWNAGCTDWYYPTFNLTVEAIDKGIGESGGIVCFHDPYWQTVSNMQAFLERYKNVVIDMPTCLQSIS